MVNIGSMELVIPGSVQKDVQTVKTIVSKTDSNVVRQKTHPVLGCHLELLVDGKQVAKKTIFYVANSFHGARSLSRKGLLHAPSPPTDS